MNYNYQIGNYVRYNLNGYARIEKINPFDGYTTYDLSVLRTYPNDTNKKATVIEKEITPIAIWAKEANFFTSLGFKYEKEVYLFRDEKNKIVVQQLAIDFPLPIGTNNYDNRVGISRVIFYIIATDLEIGKIQKEILLKAMEVKTEEDLKKFVSTEINTSYIHDIQNFYSTHSAEFSESIEKAILGF